MSLLMQFFRAAAVSVLITGTAAAVFSQKPNAAASSKRVMWEQVNIAERDLFLGPGGRVMQPVLNNAEYLGPQGGGTSIKYRIKDGAGRMWIAKVGREAKSETAAVRLLWALGYKTEINYLIPRLTIRNMGDFTDVRFEARPDQVKRLDSWLWTDNPYVGTKELDGLKIMMAMFNNWDLKDENNVILQEGDVQYYAISDLGASFGKLPEASGTKSGRTVSKPEDYARSKFVKEVRDGILELEYRGQADHLIKGIKVEHARWLADLLLQLSDKQIEDAFRAARYDDEDIKLLAGTFKARINELDAATKSVTAAR